MIKIAQCVAALLLLASCLPTRTYGDEVREYIPTYGDQFKEYYPTIEKTKPIIAAAIPLEKEVVAWAYPENGGRKAAFVRSDGSKVPYDEEIGVITIEPQKGPKQYVRAKGFRTLVMKWVNDHLLYISCDIGHTAAVEAIFDADQAKWVYQQSISYHLEQAE